MSPSPRPEIASREDMPFVIVMQGQEMVSPDTDAGPIILSLCGKFERVNFHLRHED